MCWPVHTHTHTHICIPLCRGINAAVTKMREAADCIQQLWHKFVSVRVWYAAWLHMTVNARLIRMMRWTPITLWSCNYAGMTQTGAQRLLERTFSTVWLWKPTLSVSLTQSYGASAVYSRQRKLVWINSIPEKPQVVIHDENEQMRKRSLVHTGGTVSVKCSSLLSPWSPDGGKWSSCNNAVVKISTALSTDWDKASLNYG